MAMTPESKVKEKIKQRLRRFGAYYTMPVMTGMATNGTPDFAVSYAGMYLAIEAKADDKSTPTELQWVRLAEVAKSGGSTMVIHAGNMEVLESWLRGPQLGEAMRVTVRRVEGSRRVAGHDVAPLGQTWATVPAMVG